MIPNDLMTVKAGNEWIGMTVNGGIKFNPHEPILSQTSFFEVKRHNGEQASET
jgi:hypothetical protein